MIVEYQVEGTIKRMVYVADASQHFACEANFLRTFTSRTIKCKTVYGNDFIAFVLHEFWFHCLKTKQLQKNHPLDLTI